tara:strand:- start:194 stop:451 length:258 start_codon:yes stop_codon:yes gene_type:complete
MTTTKFVANIEILSDLNLLTNNFSNVRLIGHHETKRVWRNESCGCCLVEWFLPEAVVLEVQGNHSRSSLKKLLGSGVWVRGVSHN